MPKKQINQKSDADKSKSDSDPIKWKDNFDDLYQKYKNTHDKTKIKIGYDMGKYYMDKENWDLAVETFNIVKGEDAWENADVKDKILILRSLGVSLTKPNREPYIRYLDGREQLEEALKFDRKDSDTLATLGGTWKGIDDDKAYSYYKQALEANERDPYPLVNVLIYELKVKNKFEIEEKRYNQIQLAIEKRKEQIEEFEEIPWAFFDVGMFTLLLNKFEESINYYLMALKLCKNEWTIKTTLTTLDMIKNIHHEISGIKIVRIILLLGRGFFLNRITAKKERQFTLIIRDLKSLGLKEINLILDIPTIIIAGVIDKSSEKFLQEIESNLRNYLDNFEGNVICGSTEKRIHTLVYNSIKENNRIRSYFYGPKENFSSEMLGKVSKVYFIEEQDDSNYIEIFQYWFDLLNSNINLSNLKFIGINGRNTSSIEYRIAIALGAHVGILKDTDEFSSDLISDELWKEKIYDKKDKSEIKLFEILENSMESLQKFLKFKV